MGFRFGFTVLALAVLGPTGGATPGLPVAPATQVGVEQKIGDQVPLGLTLDDESGQPLPLGALAGKPTILTLNYFRCTGICTPQLNGLAGAMTRTRLRPGRDFQVVTVSFDPTDTPAIARQKQANYLTYLDGLHHPVPPAAWRFLTGPAGATRALCAAVGFHFQAQDGGFNHPGVIVFLSAQGKVTSYLYGTSFLDSEFERATLGAMQGGVPPSGNYLFQYFQGDAPQGAPYRALALAAIAAVSLLVSLSIPCLLALRRKWARARSSGSTAFTAPR